MSYSGSGHGQGHGKRHGKGHGQGHGKGHGQGHGQQPYYGSGYETSSNQQQYDVGYTGGSYNYGDGNPQQPQPPTPTSPTPREPWGRGDGHNGGNGRNSIDYQTMAPGPTTPSRNTMQSLQTPLSPDSPGESAWYGQTPYMPPQYPTPERHVQNSQVARQPSRRPRNRDNDFTPGRIVKVRWYESAGHAARSASGRSEYIVDSYGNLVYSSWRRMVVIKTTQGQNSSTCVGIYTYGHRGLAKPGLDLRNHAVVFDENEQPYVSPDEPQPLERQPLAVCIQSPTEKLDPMSRINFGNFHTIQHNIEMCHIGYIADSYMALFNNYAYEAYHNM